MNIFSTLGQSYGISFLVDIVLASSSAVSKPICFRKPTGQTVRFVTEVRCVCQLLLLQKTREAKKIATNPPENGGATAVIGPSSKFLKITLTICYAGPLDLSSILGGNNGNAVTNSSKTPTPGPTLASMLSSISEVSFLNFTSVQLSRKRTCVLTKSIT